MISLQLFNNNNDFIIYIILKKIFYFLIIVIFIFIIINYQNLNYKYKSNKEKDGKSKNISVKKFKNLDDANQPSFGKKDSLYLNCDKSFENSNIKIIHFIITRFLIDLVDKFGKKIFYTKKYIINGIRVMNNYLLSSLDFQTCKDFIWILMIGTQANISNIKYFLNFNYSFEYDIVYEKEIKPYLRNKTKNFDVLITTRIDYDDMIYYDAVNDIRKSININKPIFLCGYNRGVYFFESNGQYYDYYRKTEDGVSSIFASLIIILNQVNDTYNIYNIGEHTHIKKNLLKNSKKYGVKEIKYEPALFDSGTIKFVKNIQKYSATKETIKFFLKGLKPIKFNISKLYKK